MQRSMPCSACVLLSTSTAVDAPGSALRLGRNRGSYDMLKAFVEASHSRGILSGVQVKLMLELAEELATSPLGEPACDDTAVNQQVPQPLNPATATNSGLPEARSREGTPPTGSQLPLANDSSNSSLTEAAVVQGYTGPEAGGSSLPQLHIQPLNLTSQLGSPPLPVAAHLSTNTDIPVQLQQALASNSNPYTQQAGGLLGFSPALLAAVAAQAQAAAATANTQQQQQQLAGLNANHLDTFPAAAQQYAAADAPAAAGACSPAAAAAGGSAPAAAAKPTAARKHRFTKEQHAAILESVERYYAVCPSRYTELVIKEMQWRFPGIEINNACVRKIKFRATEATKQATASCPAGPAATGAPVNTGGVMGGVFEARPESLAAAEAAHGLVGLSAAAGGELRAAYSAPASSADNSQADSKDGGNCDPAVTDDCTTSHCVAAADTVQRQQQQQLGQCNAALMDAMRSHPPPQGQQQTGQSSAGALDMGFTAEDAGIDSAAVAAAEAMHMLASCRSLHEPMSAAVLRSVIGGSLKRKLEEAPAAVANKTDVQAAESAVPPSAHQIADALAAAAGLACTSGAAAAPQQQQQLLAATSQELHWTLPQAAAGAAVAQQPNLQQQLQQFQQQYHHQQPQQATLDRYISNTAAPPDVQVAAVPAAAAAPAAKRQRLNGVQMAELVASVRHHVQVNPERYTHCVIKEMKQKYPELELNMGQIRKIKFRTLGNVNPRQATKASLQQTSACDPAAAAAAAAAATPLTPADAGGAACRPSAAPPGSFRVDAAKALEAVAAAAAAAASAGMGSAPAAASSALAVASQVL